MAHTVRRDLIDPNCLRMLRVVQDGASWSITDIRAELGDLTPQEQANVTRSLTKTGLVESCGDDTEDRYRITELGKTYRQWVGETHEFS